MDREQLLILMKAQRLLCSEGFDPGNDRGKGISLAAAVQFAESMLMYGDRISDDDRDLREFFDVCPLTLEGALAQIGEAVLGLQSGSRSLPVDEKHLGGA